MSISKDDLAEEGNVQAWQPGARRGRRLKLVIGFLTAIAGVGVGLAAVVDRVRETADRSY